jgi:hypothetical protein
VNCFEWQNRVSDYMDGTLAGPLKTEADEHVDSCKDCGERHKRYRQILNHIASQPRSALPVPIRKSPLSAALPKIDVAWLGRSQWERVPWYLRTTLEGVGIVLVILAGISSGPRIRALYDRGIERSLSEFTQSFSEGADTGPTTTAPLLRGNAQTVATGHNPADPANNEFSSGDEGDGPSADDDTDADAEGGSRGDQEIHVGNSETWRFILKTDSPREVRPKVVQILTELKVASDTPGLGGIEAPGGIQFDLLIPQEALASLKRQLQAMAPKPPVELAKSPAGETFIWFKNRSKQKLPNGKTRIVIWLSQM